jgi:hypothetical protein
MSNDKFIVGNTITLVCEVKEIIESKDVIKKDGKIVRMTKFMVNEGFNQIPLCIFGWFSTIIKVGNMLDLKNVYVSEYNGVKYITLGKHGSCDILNDFKDGTDVT